MADRAPFPIRGALRSVRQRQSARDTRNRFLRDELLSVAGLTGCHVRIRGGAVVGKLGDLVARWDGQAYPPLTGMLVRVGRREAFVSIDQVAGFEQGGVLLRSARLDLRDFERREGEVLLGRDVLDHQLVDCDGVRVVRASDLYVARVASRWRLVGVDVGFHSLLRRLGPRRTRNRPTPDRVIDWSAVQPFGIAARGLQLRRPTDTLARLRPSELADLLEELGRAERQELLESLEPGSAADALEEMHADELRALLRELTPPRAAELIVAMEPDEAVDALRALDEPTRSEVLAEMPSDASGALLALLDFPDDTAGGLMTTRFVVAVEHERIVDLRRRLRADPEHHDDVDAVAVVDDEGRLVDDVRLVDVFLASQQQPIGELVGPVAPLVVDPRSSVGQVVDQLVASRRSSLLVVDEDGRPAGRILSDDLIDALVPETGRRDLRHRLP